MADAVEIEFCRNRSRFKTLHYKDQMRVMRNYLLYGQMPFEYMTPRQKTDFKRMAKNYALDSDHSTLLRQITSKKRHGEIPNEHKKFHLYLSSTLQWCVDLKMISNTMTYMIV